MRRWGETALISTMKGVKNHIKICVPRTYSNPLNVNVHLPDFRISRRHRYHLFEEGTASFNPQKMKNLGGISVTVNYSNHSKSTVPLPDILFREEDHRGREIMDRKTIHELARELRKNMTPAERKLWALIRNRQLNGKKFLRQHPILHDKLNDRCRFFITDFYCAEKRLIIEVDGKIHDYQKDYDRERDRICREKGLKAVRIKNEEMKNPGRVINKIKEYL
jgi:very-short-patch-repair endonuclease